MTFTTRIASSRSDVKKWLAFPRQSVYAKDSPWVSPLDEDVGRMLNKKKNPFYLHGDGVPILAIDGSGNVVGRILAQIYHRHNARHDEKTSFFGYFECIDNQEVAKVLIEAASAFGREHGCNKLRGPFNMTAMQECGILVEGFEEPPAVDESYTAPYYPKLLESTGLKQTFPMTTFRVDDLNAVDPEKLLTARHKELIDKHNFTVRSTRKADYDRELEWIRELLNNSFYENPHFVPITNEEFEFQVGPFKRLMDPSIVLFVEQYNVPCGFGLCIPDFNPIMKKMNGVLSPKTMMDFVKGRKKLDGAALLIMGVQDHLQGKGVMRLLWSELIKSLKRAHFKHLTVTWIADVNAKSLGTVKAIGGRQLHRLCLFEKDI